MSSFSAYAIILGKIYVLHGAKTWLSLLSLCKWQYRMIHQASYNHGIIASCVLITDSFPLSHYCCLYQHLAFAETQMYKYTYAKGLVLLYYKDGVCCNNCFQPSSTNNDNKTILIMIMPPIINHTQIRFFRNNNYPIIRQVMM